ncbi:hypothetical protein HPB51_018889 [Rhipicephalus microplus]|uniref:Uncharacterized protein n=1 Tax=Rhipicephalus microplus TaxID=6941 RepID=A0A9J6D6E5_RHIMP|nr:hypothetical protein HPB51_018889 [Rhipicephalus microplus]
MTGCFVDEGNLKTALELLPVPLRKEVARGEVRPAIYAESVFDRGLRKLLDSDRFFKIDLPDFLQNIGYNLLNVRVGFSDGTLRGISTIRRRGKGTLQVDESGNSRLTFHVAGGPLEADYAAGIRAWFLRTTLDVRVRVPRFQASFTIQESSPNDLSVEVHGVRMSKGSLIFDEDDIGLEGPIYDIVFEEFRPLIQQKVGEALVRELRKLAEETLGAVKLYAVSNAERAVRGEGKMIVDSASATPDEASSNAALERSLCRRDSIRRHYPTDLGTFNYSAALVNEIEGNVTGLSSISLNGASWISVDECGIRARFDLVFKGPQDQCDSVSPQMVNEQERGLRDGDLGSRGRARDPRVSRIMKS